MRAVLDTNILISACWTPGGLEGQTVRLARAGAFTLCVSEAVWAEYREVLARDKFRAFRQLSAEMLTALQPSALTVPSIAPIHAASDPDDNRFLECASAAGAKYLVTGNLKHYPAAWGSTKIVNARQFLNEEFRSVA